MSEILVRYDNDPHEIRSVVDLIGIIADWRHKYAGSEGRSHDRLWLRGNAQHYPNPLRPKVFRDEFTKRAKDLYPTTNKPTVTLERELLKEFRTSGAHHFEAKDAAEVYFTAQHFGMPTRLLDWTTNPLIALFFSAKDHVDKDGELFVMDALGVLPERPHPAEDHRFPSDILTMRRGDLIPLLEESFEGPGPTFPRIVAADYDPRKHDPSYMILPVRPDNRPGRIGQQNSRFTLHGYGSEAKTNQTAIKCSVMATSKSDILAELRQLNINEYTIYNDLDHLSKTICDLWEVN